MADFASEPNLINGFSVVWDAGAGKLLKAGKYTPEVASFAKKIIANGNKVFNKILEYIPSKKIKTAIQNIWAKFKAKFGGKGCGGAPKGDNGYKGPKGWGRYNCNH